MLLHPLSSTGRTIVSAHEDDNSDKRATRRGQRNVGAMEREEHRNEMHASAICCNRDADPDQIADIAVSRLLRTLQVLNRVPHSFLQTGCPGQRKVVRYTYLENVNAKFERTPDWCCPDGSASRTMTSSLILGQFAPTVYNKWEMLIQNRKPQWTGLPCGASPSYHASWHINAI